MSPPVYGLVLAGGRSARMGRDKAALRYQGRSQLERAMELLGSRLARSFVSVRPDQRDDPLRRGFSQIVDDRENLGPIAGILAAQAQHPQAAWLVLACDLPHLDAASLDHLLAGRAPQRLATAYRSTHDGLPEPLCAIWEPASHPALVAYIESGGRCPRKFLIGADALLLDQPVPKALDNVNTPEEYGSAMNQTDKPQGPAAAPLAGHRLRVQYFALLREQAGRSEETLETAARTPRELYAQLRQRYPFSLAPEMLRVAVNGDFGEWEQALREGDAVVFIPPVAGG